MHSLPNKKLIRVIMEEENVLEQAQGYRADFFRSAAVGAGAGSVQINISAPTTVHIHGVGERKYEVSIARTEHKEEKTPSCWDRCRRRV